MSVIASIPILIILLILQTTIAREVTLLNGAVDLVLVWLAAWGLLTRDKSGFILAIISGTILAFITALPWYVYIAAYLSVIILARFVFNKLWESPLLAMFAITMVSSIILYILTFAGLRIDGIGYPLEETLNRVIIPSIFLNLFLAMPIYAIVRDFSGWFKRAEDVS